MAQRSEFGRHSNDDLVRLLYANKSQSKPAKKADLPPPDPTAEPLASRRVSELEPQQWPLGPRNAELEPLSDREERALFAALLKGTKANLGREPTVPELMLIVERINDARAFLAEAEQVLQGQDSVYVKDGRIVFSRPPQRRLRDAA
jgi:hypothetical protein